MNGDFLLSHYDYPLPPPDLVAQRPLACRHQSRLLVYNQKKDSIQDARFVDLPHMLPPQSTLVFNDTRVLPLKLLGKKETGGAAEILLIPPLSGPTQMALIKTNGKKRPSTKIFLGPSPNAPWAEIISPHGSFFTLKLSKPPEEILKSHGRMPLPPYIRRGRGDERDERDYQTLHARHPSSCAAPTAGLHFDQTMHKTLREGGMESAHITLHVGPGTFRPVETEDIRNHRMHREEYRVDGENGAKIKRAKNLVAVGTTSLRALESFARGGSFSSGYTTTDIFLRPGVDLTCGIRGLITNFHLPRSSLLILVASLVGRKRALELYDQAQRWGYRFFSYGDAMLILLKP